MGADLGRWLIEQIDEDERVARDAGPARVAWATYRREDGSMRYTSPVAEHDDIWVADGHETEPTGVMVVFDPARVLAECLAKRQIIQDHKVIPIWPHGTVGAKNYTGYKLVCASCDNRMAVPCWTLKWLALPYADRPGYREEWRVQA
jgi:hypothetical protein